MSFSPALTTFEAAEKVLEDELLEVMPGDSSTRRNQSEIKHLTVF